MKEKMKESDSGRWSETEKESGSESENGRENGKGSEEGQDLEVETDTGMEAARPPIDQGVTARLIPEKKVAIGIVRERGNIDTRKDIAHAPTLTDTKGRDPLETDHLTLVKESARRPKRGGKRVQQRAGVKTEQSVETGWKGRGLPPRTWLGPGNERDLCRTSETGAPALRSGSLGRYERGGCL